MTELQRRASQVSFIPRFSLLLANDTPAICRKKFDLLICLELDDHVATVLGQEDVGDDDSPSAASFSEKKIRLGKLRGSFNNFLQNAVACPHVKNDLLKFVLNLINIELALVTLFVLFQRSSKKCLPSSL